MWIRHNKRWTRIYKIWEGMKARCNNQNHASYDSYGGRGIKLCKEWHDFMMFDTWATSNGYNDSLSIDRIDNDGNYEPSNCRWVTMSVQTRNTKRLHKHNTSGYRGVHFHKQRNKFQAKIKVGEKSISLGLYNCRLKASYAYDKYVTDNRLEHTKNWS